MVMNDVWQNSSTPHSPPAEPAEFAPPSVTAVALPAPAKHPALPVAAPVDDDLPRPQHYSVPPAAAAQADLPATGEFEPPAGLADAPPAPVSIPLPLPTAADSGRGGAGADDEGVSMVAGTARIVSEAFNSGFSRSVPGWRTEVSAPVGMSTEGGKQAGMPITLVNELGQRIAIGHADAAARRVTLKPHLVLQQHYTRRYARDWNVSPEHYGALLEDITAFFSAMQFVIDTDVPVSLAPSPLPTPKADETTRLRRFIALLVVCVVLLAGYLLSGR